MALKAGILCLAVAGSGALQEAAPRTPRWSARARDALDARAETSRAAADALRSFERNREFAALVGRRLLEDSSADYDDACVSSFSSCEADEACLACVLALVDGEDDDVDLPDDAEDWRCPQVVSFLHAQDLCPNLDADSAGGALLCEVWTACADDVDEDGTPAPVPAPVVCSATACDVPHEAWLGDGRCDRKGCYNTAACGWDGGDCCEATCEGSCEGPFTCRDPAAQGCGKRARAEVHAEAGSAPFSYSVYSVILGTYAEVATKTVEPGVPSTETTCLADGCYVVEATADATFGDGAAWSVRTADRQTGDLAAAPVASGKAPGVCMFAVGANGNEYCPATCAPTPEDAASCPSDDAYQMELFDAGYNGWGFVGYSVHKHDTNGVHGKVMKEGGLSAGHFGVDTICLPDPGCYTVTLAWGWWAEEISWVLGKPGIGAVAQGGAPAQCDFSVGGDFCPSTCVVEPDTPEVTGGCDATDASKLPYKLELYDEEGDGWNGATYKILGDDEVPITGTLLGGFQGEDDLCLAPGCYDFTFAPSKGNAKPAWALGDPTEGGAVFSGSRTADCVFAVGGGECPTGPHTKDHCGFAGSETPPPTAVFTCKADEALLVMRLTDSWGDGWNGEEFSVEDGTGTEVARGTLDDGAYKEFPYCLEPGCYTVKTTSGEWREEISWQAVELLPGGGTEVRAHGAAPEECGLELTAGLGDVADDSTCDVGCVTKAAAEDDWIGGGDDDYWGEDDDLYGYYAYDDKWASYDDDAKAPPARCAGNRQCSVQENFQGWNAATSLGDCLGRYSPPSPVDNPFEPELWAKRPELCLGTYDFGELDEFEDCAADLRASRASLEAKNDLARKCMALLVSAAPDASEDLESDDELVKRLATMVYYAGDTGFCDCATDEKAIPHCADFDDFRAVVREAHEACDALDRVDCAYLGAYADACRAALVNEFGSLDLKRKDQCAYVDEVGCGGLPIPAVRRWDCLLDDNYELSPSQRDLVTAVIDECAEATDDKPVPAPASTNDDTVEEASGGRSSHSSSDDGSGGGFAALMTVGALAAAAVGAALFYVFVVKGRRNLRFGDAESELGAGFFTPVPNTPTGFEDSSSFGPDTPGATGPSPFGDGGRGETRNPMLPL